MGTLDHRLMSCSLIRTAALRHSGRAGRASRALCTADPNGVAAYEQRGQRLQPLMRAAVNRGLLPPATATNPMADFYDMDALDNRLNEMHQAFHEPFFTHCFAVKANPIRGILSRVVAAGGGLECASTGEVEHSRSLGAPTVIFDSPCKSRDQLRDVLVNMPEVYINLDNEQEMIDIEHTSAHTRHWRRVANIVHRRFRSVSFCSVPQGPGGRCAPNIFWQISHHHSVCERGLSWRSMAPSVHRIRLQRRPAHRGQRLA